MKKEEVSPELEVINTHLSNPEIGDNSAQILTTYQIYNGLWYLTDKYIDLEEIGLGLAKKGFSYCRTKNGIEWNVIISDEMSNFMESE